MSGSAKVREQLRNAELKLTQAGVLSPGFDASAIAAHILGCTRAELTLKIARGDDFRLGPQFDELIAERARRIPLQHLTGVAEFYGHEFSVGPGVFIPRPETEVLVTATIAAATKYATPVIVDLCTGSAAIAIAVALAVPAAQVHGVELSAQALAWAQRNTALLAPQVNLHLGDAANALGEWDSQVDVLVSNPPYVPPGAVPVDPEVREHDPELALYGLGPDGLAVPAAVIRSAARLLKPGGTLLLEHADVQQAAVLRLLAGPPWRAATGHPDLTGRPRFVMAVRTELG